MTKQNPPLIVFSERIKTLPSQLQNFYTELSDHIKTFCDIKCRTSMRCESYRFGKKLLAKIAIGGKTLKIFLALDKSDEDIARIKVNSKDVSGTKAYVDVPYLLTIRSELAVKKACIIITQMMRKYDIQELPY